MQQHTVIMLKPDCLERGLVDDVVRLLRPHVEIRACKRVVVDEDRIVRHYHELIERRGATARRQLCAMYLDRPVIVLLAAGEDAIGTVRALIGPADPAQAPPETIRGRFGDDSFARAAREQRLVHNLIHAASSPADVERELEIWFSA